LNHTPLIIGVVRIDHLVGRYSVPMGVSIAVLTVGILVARMLWRPHNEHRAVYLRLISGFVVAVLIVLLVIIVITRFKVLAT
jgi:hypothetical protein